MCSTHESNRLRSTESSVESCANEQNRDNLSFRLSYIFLPKEAVFGIMPANTSEHQTK